jgi:ribonuclease HI
MTITHYHMVTTDEIDKVIRNLNYVSVPGHDRITYQLIAKFHSTYPSTLPHLFNTLFWYEAFPDLWKIARCVVIPKPRKPSYTIPTAYWPISLLPCISKMYKQNAANRITHSATQCLAISPNQMGVRSHYSAIDTLLKVLSPISTDLSFKKKQPKRKLPYCPTLLTHDIEGAFNNMTPALLLQIMQQRGIPPYLCEWICSFTTNRKLAFTFSEQLEEPKPFLCSLPQGSPASPILVLIYANAMLEVQHQPAQDLNVSYVDDTSFLQSSLSTQFTIKHLKQWSEYHINKGKHLSLCFSPPKSELLHCLPKLSKDKTKDLSYHPPLIINDQTIPPSWSIKYLSIHIDESLTLKQHAISVAAKGKSVLGSLLFLWHGNNRISTYIARHLILTLILPKMLWASPAWWTGTNNILSPLATAYHSAARWATSLIPSIRISNLLACTHLPLLNVYLNYLSTKYAIRLLFLPAEHSLTGIPTTPNCPTSVPRISQLRNLIKHLTTGKLENWATTPITFSLQLAPPVHTTNNDQSHTHHQEWISSLPIGTLLLYTDGSKLDSEQVGCGAATYKITDHGLWHLQFHYCNLGTWCEVFDAELHTIHEGLCFIPTSPTSPNTSIYICIDNQAVIQMLAYNQHNHQYACETLTATEILTNNGWNLSTLWTPSHTNIPGNEHADTLAKTGTQSLTACPSTITSMAWLNAQAHQ